MDSGNAGARRLLIVANRSAFTATERGNELVFSESVGGLVSGMTAYLDSVRAAAGPDLPYLWVGWPGGTISAATRPRLKKIAATEYLSHPVFLSEEMMAAFYQGFCNSTIWPLFHYFPMFTTYDREQWEVYRQVNEVYCDALMEVLRPGDVVWIHDYHLMLLPRMLRDRAPGTRIGFFLHIPFPGYEVFRLLPRAWGTEILQGLLGADLVGFHTFDYSQYFLRSVMRLLGHEHTMGQIMLQDRVVKVDTFPMGIDYDRFASAAESTEVEAERAMLRSSLPDAKVVLSIDRLDYSKGILNRLRGFECFLEENPDYHKKVVLALVVVPSRIGVYRYDQTKGGIEEMVGRINGRFGSIDWAPIRYQYRTVPFSSLIALYGVGDIALVTPLRDGMNLISKEYVASHGERGGVLILSEMAGSAKELGEAIIVNPNSKEEISAAIREALEMPPEEQARRNRAMQQRLRRYNVVRWADDFMRELDASEARQERYRARVLPSHAREELMRGYARASSRLLFLDYDGTLMPFAIDPQRVPPSQRVLEVLRRLSSDRCNRVYLVSGRDRDTLDAWFGGLRIGMVAEHGVWLKGPGEEWRILQPLESAWKESIRPVLEIYVDRLPGSFIEEKSFSLAWHYRAADPELGALRASELNAYLVSFIANINVQVLQGHKVLEVKSAGVNKGSAASALLAEGRSEFVLAVGDDLTDEHLFSVLPEGAYSLRVGLAQSVAGYNLRNPGEVLDLLEQLSAAAESSRPTGAPLAR